MHQQKESQNMALILPRRRVAGKAYSGHTPASGFTLIELMTVIFIIGLLIGILIPSLTAARNFAKKTGTSAVLKALGRPRRRIHVREPATAQRSPVGELIEIRRIRDRSFLSVRDGVRVLIAARSRNEPPVASLTAHAGNRVARDPT